MRKFIMLIKLFLLFITLVHNANSQPYNIAEWTFNNTNIASDVIPSNKGIATFTTNSTGSVTYPTGTTGTITNPPSISNSGWSSGASWSTQIVTKGYENMTLNFKQRGSNTSPKDWEVLVNGISIGTYY